MLLVSPIIQGETITVHAAEEVNLSNVKVGTTKAILNFLSILFRHFTFKILFTINIYHHFNNTDIYTFPNKKKTLESLDSSVNIYNLNYININFNKNTTPSKIIIHEISCLSSLFLAKNILYSTLSTT